MLGRTPVVCILLASGSVASAQTEYIHCARGTNSTGADKADFHATVTNNNLTEVQIDWVLDVANGVEIRYGAAGSGPKVEQVEVKDVHFTPRANARDNMPPMGRRVDDVGNVHRPSRSSLTWHTSNRTTPN